MKKTRAWWAGLLGLGMVVSFLGLPAQATNRGTESGDHSVVGSCIVEWETAAVLDADLTNDDPKYPNLMVDLAGQPVHYTNGGYISEVTPTLGGAGIFEMNHFYVRNTNQAWRVPTSTDRTIYNAKVRFTPPQDIPDDVTVQFDAVSVNDRIAGWGEPYGKYKWAPAKQLAQRQDDGSWILDLGTIPAGTGTVYQWNLVSSAAGFRLNDQYVAKATLSGNYATGDGDCPMPTLPPKPEPSPDLGVCEVEYLGVTVWSAYARDITERTKLYSAGASEDWGEINADGWGVGADGWTEGSTRTVRLYSATRKPLESVKSITELIQGADFAPSPSVQVDSPGFGQLQQNGYVNAVVDASVTTAPKQVGVTIAQMPQDSSLSFNLNLVLDDSKEVSGAKTPIVLHHRLRGTIAGCDPTPEPTPTPTPSPTATPTPSPTATPTPSPTATPTPSPTATQSPRPSVTPSHPRPGLPHTGA